MRAASCRACGWPLPVRTVADLRSHANLGPHTFAPAAAGIGAAAMPLAHPSVESVCLQPIRHSHNQP
ncbi:hypothetical protein ABD05_24385 [Burkholderia pyrrocinia]|nr:hypothetical protein ABD05_24385 [Burkholderia pyrrocinia]